MLWAADYLRTAHSFLRPTVFQRAVNAGQQGFYFGLEAETSWKAI